jgi:aspartate/methionine/tyrosine aminotransferase
VTRPLLNRRLDGLGNSIFGVMPPLATIDGMRGRLGSIGSAGKTFSFTGWKVGWATATPDLINAVRTTKQFLTFVSSGPFQYAVAQALDLPDSCYTDMATDLTYFITASPSPKATTAESWPSSPT